MMLRIGYFGDGPWAHQALEKIINDKRFEIAYIVVRYDSGDEVLKSYAKKLQVPYLRHKNVNEDEFIKEIEKYDADINVSMSFNQILKKKIINLAPKKFINCHAGALPFYRGRNILNWAIINGEKKFGVTVHYVDEGIDTGDIILQKFAPIDINDRYGDLLKKAYTLCADTLYEVLKMIDGGNVSVIKQSSIHPVGFYCSSRHDGDENIDWNWPSKRIYDFVRGIANPAPGARAIFRGKEVIIDRADLIDGALSYIDKPGNVVGKKDGSVVVKTGDSTILIKKIIAAESNEEVELGNVHIGDRFYNKM